MSKHNKDEGLKMTIKEFEKTLQEDGVEEIECLGKKFDPEIMDAIEIVDVETVTGKVSLNYDTVVEVTQKGYTYKSKVLRPAKVKVGHRKENSNE